MRQLLLFFAAIISTAGALPYIIDILKNKTHPNIVSWGTWTLLNAISAAAAYGSGATETAIFSTFSAAITGVIVILGIKKGVKKYTRFDVICQVAALVGIIAWQLTAQPSLAVLIALLVNMLATLPTLRHAWNSPHAETWQAFATGFVASILTLASISDYTFVSLAFPLHLAFNGLLLTWVILYRRRKLPQQPAFSLQT